MVMTVYTAAELAAMDIETPEFIIEGLMPVGLSFLVGKPKAGKSLLATQFSLAIASGDAFLGRATRNGSVLYIDQETHLGHLRDRLERQANGRNLPASLFIASGAPGLTKGLEDAIKEFLEEHPEAVIVVIDTFGRVMPDGSPNQSDYLYSVRTLEPLARLAEKHGIAIVLVHHARKSGPGGEAGDPFESIMGSQGLFGTADAALVLNREPARTNAKLHARGRAMEECEVNLLFNKRNLRWEVGQSVTVAEQFGFTEREDQVIDLLRDQDLSNGEIAGALGIKPNNASNLLKNMLDKGLVEKRAGRKYGLPPTLLEDLNDVSATDTHTTTEVEGVDEVSEGGEEGESEEAALDL